MFRKLMFYGFSFFLFAGSCAGMIHQFMTIESKAPSASREPSSIQRVYDYSDLKGSALAMAAKDRLVNSINLKNTADDLTISMGNFVLLNDDKQKVFACGYFDKLSLTFEATGVIVGDEKPSLTIISDCEVSGNINEMAPISVSLAGLKSQRPSNTEYKSFDNGKAVTILVSHSPSSWPTEWILKSVKLTHSQISSRSIQIPTFEMGMGRRHQISMQW